MKRLLVIIFTVSAFLGGYYLRGLEGSPDVFGWAERNYPRFAEATRDVWAAIGPDRLAASDQRADPQALAAGGDGVGNAHR